MNMKTHYSKWLKIVTVLGLIFVLSIIAVNFVSRSKSNLPIDNNTKKAVPNRLEDKEKIEHIEVVKGVKKNFDFTAGRHYLAKDGLYHLEGNVRAVLTKTGRDQDIVLEGNEVVHDKERSFFFLQGKAKIESGDLEAESSSIEYTKSRGVFLIKKGVVLKSDKIQGSARQMEFSDLHQKIKLTKDVRIQLKPNIETRFPLIILTNFFEYNHEQKRGSARDGVQLIQGESTASAKRLSFSLTPDGNFIKELVLKGKVRAVLLQEEHKVASIDAESAFPLFPEKRTIQAGDLRIKGFRNLSQVRSFSAHGGSRISFEAPSGESTLIQAKSIDLFITREGRIREFKAEHKARIIQKNSAGELLQLLEGNKLTIAKKRHILNVKGQKDLSPRFVNLFSDITAETISINLKSGAFEAAGGLKVILRMTTSRETPGLFEKDIPVFITASSLRYSAMEKRFLFKGHIQIWQADTIFQADELFLWTETGKIQGAGHIISRMMFQPDKDANKTRIVISAEKMQFDPDKNLMSFKDKSVIQIDDLSVSAGRVFILIKEGKGQIREMTASGDVHFKQGGRGGKAEEAHYDLNNRSVTLVGNPEIIDPIKGTFQGNKLTFYMSDDRILVDNKGQDRSITVIK